MRRQLLVLFVLASLTGLVACSSSNNPASPSPVSGVTLNGSVVAPGGGGGSTNGTTTLSGPSPAGTIPAGLTVSVVGTNVSVQVDASGRFAIRGVPAGNVELRFTAPGMAASVTLTGLLTGQTVTITVSLDGSVASLESDRRSGAGEDQLEGRVESLPPTTAALTFVAAGQTVTTDTNTKFYLRGAPASFNALEIGQRVHVKGKTSGGSLLASSVDIQNTNTSIGVEINGVIANFSGTASAFQFEVDGRLVKGDAATEFFGNSLFTDLANGRTVQVKGSQRDGFVYAVRLHVDVEATEVDFTGVISAISGTAPTLTLTVGTTTVTTTSGTEVQRKGDVQSPAALQVGMTVEVDGLLQSDGSVVAKKIHIENDATGGLFEITGTLAGSSGTCPTISFSVSGYSIATTGTTVFVPSCSALTNGTQVEVHGIVQAGGSISATKVEKK